MQMLGINKLHVEKIDLYPFCYLTLIKSETPQGSKVKKVNILVWCASVVIFIPLRQCLSVYKSYSVSLSVRLTERIT